jgi:hypothetical protein
MDFESKRNLIKIILEFNKVCGLVAPVNNDLDKMHYLRNTNLTGEEAYEIIDEILTDKSILRETTLYGELEMENRDLLEKYKRLIESYKIHFKKHKETKRDLIEEKGKLEATLNEINHLILNKEEVSTEDITRIIYQDYL